MSWTAKILDKHGKILLINIRFKDGRCAYYYLLCKEERGKELIEAAEQFSTQVDDINLEEYGAIIESGWDAPTQEVIDRLKKKYDLLD